MDIYVRKRVRNPSGTLFVTFLLGIAIGFTLGYALKKPAQDPVTQAALDNTPVTAETEPAVAPATNSVLESPPPAEPAPAPASPTPSAAEPQIWPGRYLFVAVSGKELAPAEVASLMKVKPTAVVLRDENLVDREQAAKFCQAIKGLAANTSDLSYMPPLVVADESTLRRVLKLDVPTPVQIGKDKSPQKARAAGRAVGKAAVECGFDILLGPTLNVPVDKKAPGDNPDLFGIDQALVATLGLAYADGLRDGGVIAVVKQYPALQANQGQTLDVTKWRLSELLYPFLEAATKNIPGIVVGHIAVPMLDKQDPARPAALSPVMVKRVMRELPDWNYNGIILAGDIAAPNATVPPEKAAVDALAAGCDAVLCFEPAPEKLEAVAAAIEQALGNQTLNRAGLVQSASRLNVWIERLGSRPTIEDLAEEPAPKPEPVTPPPAAAEAAPVETATSAPAEAAPAVSTPAAGTSAETTPAAPTEAAPAPTPAETTPVAPAEAPAPASSLPEQVDAVPVPATPEPKSAPASEAVAPAPPAPQPTPAQESVTPAPPAPAPETAPAPASPAPAPEPESEKAPEPETKPVAEKAEPKPVQPANTEKVLHEVVEGDTLLRIANQYDVESKDILKWNDMKDSTVRYGTKLVVYQKKIGGAPVESEKSGEETADAAKPEEKPASPSVQSEETDKYTVQPGDTSRKIANKFGISVQKLAEMNNIANLNHIELGQQLRVPKK